MGMTAVFSSESIITLNMNGLNTPTRDFSGGPGVKNLPSKVRDTGLIPGEGTKIYHVMEQPSPCTTTTELVYSRAHVLQLRRPRAYALQQEKPPQQETHTAQLQRAQCSNKEPVQPK